MTALVGILNKRAAVIAADSAMTATRGGTTKIYNTANKIFRLSNTKPVGVMIYDSSQYMNTPWDVLFKLYRDKRSDRSFDTLKEYADDFLTFLKNEKHCNNSESQTNFLNSELSTYYYKIKDIMSRECEEIMKKEEVNDVGELMKERLYENFRISNEVFDESGACPELETYSLRNLRSFAEKSFDELMELCKEDDMPGTREEWEENFFKYLRSCTCYNETGVVFVGYGEDDIYPSMIPTHVAGMIDGRLRYYFDEAEIISNDNDASIQPFAQTDTMISLMKGIHPTMYETILNKVDESLSAAKQQIIESLEKEGVKDSTVTKVKDINLDNVSEKFHEDMKAYIVDTFVDGIIAAVGAFNIEDMITMAESLISITNLQRHFSSSDESVGGPVDVAVITKSEGFVWVNHKQWYQQQMNSQYVEKR